ncbi:MAG: hypothetical protein GC178_09015 [Flavobacteriales bacterium]|nr:hypothetical protein [Flavobacteriales bacterium]
MKYAFLFVSVLFLSSCSTDGLVPCDGEGPSGELCREYRYFNGSPEGYVEFEHAGDSLLISRIFDDQHRLQKTVKQWFEDGRTSVIAEQYPDADTKVQTWNYNQMDSLETIVYGANDSSLFVMYENGKRRRESYFEGDSLQRYFIYRYFQDDGNLYRIYHYNSEDSLLAYRSFEYFFSTGQTRVSFYTSSNDLIGRKVFRFSQNGLISSTEFTDSTATVTAHSEYIYDASQHLTEKSQTNSDGTYRSVFLYY